MGKAKPKRDRSAMPFTAAWMAKMKPAWNAYREKIAKVRKVKSERPSIPVRLSLPCAHVGDSLTATEVERYGLNRRRSWHRCELGLAKNKLGIPGVSCVCEGCGPKCEGYQSQEKP